MTKEEIIERLSEYVFEQLNSPEAVRTRKLTYLSNKINPLGVIKIIWRKRK